MVKGVDIKVFGGTVGKVGGDFKIDLYRSDIVTSGLNLSVFDTETTGLELSTDSFALSDSFQPLGLPFSDEQLAAAKERLDPNGYDSAVISPLADILSTGLDFSAIAPYGKEVLKGFVAQAMRVEALVAQIIFAGQGAYEESPSVNPSSNAAPSLQMARRMTNQGHGWSKEALRRVRSHKVTPEMIVDALRESGNNITKAAAALGRSYSTVRNRIIDSAAESPLGQWAKEHNLGNSPPPPTTTTSPESPAAEKKKTTRRKKRRWSKEALGRVRENKLTEEEILKALVAANNNMAEAARVLGRTRAAISDRVKRAKRNSPLGQWAKEHPPARGGIDAYTLHTRSKPVRPAKSDKPDNDDQARPEAIVGLVEFAKMVLSGDARYTDFRAMAADKLQVGQDEIDNAIIEGRGPVFERLQKRMLTDPTVPARLHQMFMVRAR